MSIEHSHGAARPTLPRSSDLATVPPAEQSRTEGRDAHGRFTASNPWSAASKWRALIAEGLGRDLEGKAGELGRRAHRLYRAFLADLPVDCATVRSLVAQHARAATLADAYSLRAAELGIDTPEGARVQGEAHKWCQRAERLAVTSLDVATKLAGVARKRPVIDLGKAIAEASKEGSP